MKLKKCLAIVMAAVLMLTCLPLLVSAETAVPTVLYVGEKDKSDDNLIKMYNETGHVIVYSVNEDKSYYELTYDEAYGYILTFHNNYKMSDVVTGVPAGECGLYCNGDLTVRIDGYAEFDLNQKFGTQTYNYTYGWYVKGTLTIEGGWTGDTVVISADTKHTDEGNGCIGVYADTLLLNRVTLNACGGFAGIQTTEAIGMIDAKLYANIADDMKDAKGNPLFRYGIVSENFIQVNGSVKVGGPVDIKAYDFRGGTHEFDEDIVVYLRVFEFKPNSKTGKYAYSGYWRESFDLFNGRKYFPDCIQLVGNGRASVLELDGDKATLGNIGDLNVQLVLQCGRASAVLSSYDLNCGLAWWQWIVYFFSFKWINAN